MRKSLLMTAIALMAMLAGSTAMAESLQGRFGVTGRLGLLVPADSEKNDAGRRVVVETDPGFIGGGGLIYGVDNHVALELDVTHSEFHGKEGLGTAKVNNVSVGGQYRFSGNQQAVPYVGVGVDILMSDLRQSDVDTVLGFHLSAGADYFLSRELALTAELKGVQAFDADITTAGAKVGDFDPSSLSATVGFRFFFN